MKLTARQEPHGSEQIQTITPARTSATESRQNRNREMQLIPEALARAHMSQLHRDAQEERLYRRALSARRVQRRAERASMKARRALASAVMS